MNFRVRERIIVAMADLVSGDERRRVVLIDDSEIVLRTQADALTRAGFEIRAASSLREFINLVLDWKPHVIVSDLYMPEMNGAELCQWLRAQIPTARIPVVICSGAKEHELADIAQKAGADAFVSKHGGVDALRDRLSSLFEEIVW